MACDPSSTFSFARSGIAARTPAGIKPPAVAAAEAATAAAISTIAVVAITPRAAEAAAATAAAEAAAPAAEAAAGAIIAFRTALVLQHRRRAFLVRFDRDGQIAQHVFVDA